jgi:hypothetical protein
MVSRIGRGYVSRLKALTFRLILMHGKEARTAEADQVGHLQDPREGVWLGTVEAPDEATATEKAAAKFKVPVVSAWMVSTMRLMLFFDGRKPR